jgi:hypothetical protein
MYYFNHVDERGWARLALGALVALPIALGGCVASIREVRLYGAARPAMGARSEQGTERQAGIDGAAECRDLIVTAPMVRDVEIRRSFADDAQERNAVLAELLLGGIGLVTYSQDQVPCPQSGDACSDLTKAADSLIGLAAIPLAFIAYNAVAVQDSQLVEQVAPEVRPGPWRPPSPASCLWPPWGQVPGGGNCSASRSSIPTFTSRATHAGVTISCGRPDEEGRAHRPAPNRGALMLVLSALAPRAPA